MAAPPRLTAEGATLPAVLAEAALMPAMPSDYVRLALFKSVALVGYGSPFTMLTIRSAAIFSSRALEVLKDFCFSIAEIEVPPAGGTLEVRYPATYPGF